MGWLKKLSIKSKMILSFVSVTFVFMIFAVFSIMEMNELGKLTAKLYEHPLKVSNAAIEAQLDILRMHGSMTDIKIASSEMELNIAIKAVDSVEKDVYEHLYVVRNRILGKEGAVLVQEAISLFSMWKLIRTEVVERVSTGDMLSADRIIRGEGAEHVSQLNRKVEELSSYAKNKADSFMKEANKVQQRVMRNTIIAISTAALMALFITFRITKSILSSVFSLKNTMSKIVKTRTFIKSDLSGNNEIAEMARHFNRLVDRLQGQFWFKDGQNALSQELSGDLTYEELATKAINFISRCVDACAGALYVYDENRSICQLKASYALVEGKQFTHEFEIGEGIVGQVAFEEKPILLNGISGEDTLVKTGTVSLPPRSIYALPLLYHGKFRGVLEVSLFEDISPLKIEFLHVCAEIISTSLFVAAQKEQIENLLNLAQKNNEELNSQAEELQVQTEELQQTSDELQEQNIELETQREQVEQASRLKSEFLANMSHELRTPLNSVMALSRVLIRQAEDKLSEEEIKYLKVIARNGKNLLSLINDILDLSKIEAGRIDLSIKRLAIGPAVDIIMERLEPLAEEKGIQILRKIPDDLPQIESDEIRVHQILQNLVGNAVKFTNTGNVTVSAFSDSASIYIEVADTGIGISEKDLPNIFEEFRQVDGSSARVYEGTGLGLTIAYRSARMLGGDLTVESVPGEGSKFTFTLPIMGVEKIGGQEHLTSMSPVEISEGQKTILVVDDDPDVATMIVDYLLQEGYHALVATSGEKAVELAEKHNPFAITLDIVMPDMDGWEVLQRLKNNPATKDIPVIIVSMADDRDIGFALGAIGYSTKPVKKDVLLSEIKKIGGPSPHTIMFVDDNEFEIKEMSQIIENEGMQSVIAGGGIKCMQMIQESIPDVLVLDLIMPDMDGFEVLEKIRSNPETRSLPVIILTAKDITPEDKEKLTGKISSILVKSDNSSISLLEGIKKVLGEMCGQTISGGGLDSNRILIVEDNEAAVIQVRSILESAGYQVDVARGGKEALSYLHDTVPAGIILDLMMPEVDGFAVLENIRSHKTTVNIPVLILTAKDLAPQDHKKLTGNNVQQLIQKGNVAREDLLFKVRTMLGLKVPKADKIQVSRPEVQQTKPVKVKDREGSPTILVVEDNPDNMITIKAVLNNQYTILEAIDGEVGLSMALTLQPDLILLDMFLPRMDGLTVVGKIKEEDRTRNIPVIAMTAKAMNGDREKIIDAGCDDYISKPIEPDDVLNLIDEWLRKVSCI